MTNLVIFDIDGTLTSFQDEEETCFNQTVLEVLGVSDFNQDWGSYKNVTYSGFVFEISENHLGRAPSDEEMVKFENEFIKTYEPAIRSGDPAKREIPGANEMLTRLRQVKNLQIAIATGNWRSVAELKLNGAGINFAGIPMSTSSDALSREDIMKSAENLSAEKYGGHPFKKITYIGDGEWDARASQKLRYDFIGITTKVSEEIFQKYGSKAVFSDYTDPDAFIDAIGVL